MLREDLVEKLKQGEIFKYLLFWGHRPAADGHLCKSCLSQWWPAPFKVDGLTYPTAEHWMMAAKASLFGDQVICAKILAAATPGEAKALGRQVRDYDDVIWEARRFEYVVEGNLQKFQQHPELGDWLCGTGQRILVEASPVDRIWGIGLDQTHPDALVPAKWPGLNLLGFALMEVREKLNARAL